jgi:hypothetical protein
MTISQIEMLTRDHLIALNFTNTEPFFTQDDCLNIYNKWVIFRSTKADISYNSFIKNVIFS